MKRKSSTIQFVLTFVLVLLLAMVGTTFAEPSLFPTHVGVRMEYNRRDSIGNEWTVQMELDHQKTIDSLTYFHLQRWNYGNDGAFEDLGYARSTEEAMYMYNPSGPDDLVFQKAPVGTKWSFYFPDPASPELDYLLTEITDIGPVTVPYGTFDTAYLHRKCSCADPDDLSKGQSPYHYEWIVPGVGYVKQVNFWGGDNPPLTMELVDVTSVVEEALDIERIGMCSQKDHLDGTTPINPWRFEVDIHLVDPGTLHHIDVTLPNGGMTSFTIYEDSGDWEYHSSPTLYPTLTALQAVYPTGLYTFDFRDSSGSLIKSVQLDYSGIDEPGSPVDFTYPSDNGQTGISTNPTLTWTVNSGAGHALGMAFKADDDDIYNNVHGTMETLSWQPGPLDPEQNCWLYVTVVRIKDWAGGPGLPTMTVGGDEFEYLLHIGYMNKIGFTTGPTVEEAPDIDSIHFETKKVYRAGTLETDPFDVGAMVFGANINSVQVTSPTNITEVLTTDGVNGWYWDREEKYATLEDLHQDFPPGSYVFTFNEGEDTEDSVTVWGEPEQPTGFANITYPADGATDVPVTPTFKWGPCSGYGDSLLVGVVDIETDTDPYIEGLNIGQISWTPGPFVPGRPYQFGVGVQKARPMQLLTTVNGDDLNYFDVFTWRNYVRFTIPSEPQVMIAGLALFIMDEVDLGNIDPELEVSLLVKVYGAISALDRGNPNDAKVAMNDLKALINHVEAQIDKKITPEAAAEIIQRVNTIISALGG